MRMLSGRMHWLTVGLALLISAQGFATKRLHGQGGAMPAGGMMMPDRPMSMVFQGPPPMEVVYASATGACDVGCDTAGGYGAGGFGSCGACGNAACGGRGCGVLGRLGGGAGGCAACGGAACGGAGCGLGLGGNGCLFGGGLMGMMGCLAPYAEGGVGAPRYFDFYAGTIGLSRTSEFGGFATPDRDNVTGIFSRSYLVSTEGVAGTPRLSTNDLDLDKMRYGLELIANLQTGPGANVEARYFGLNNWNVTQTVQLATPTLFSVYSLYGTDPAGGPLDPPGFDDTDRSFIHSISYSSELHNGEVNYRRRFSPPFAATQASWLAGVRYFDLDERFAFNAVGSQNDTFTFDQLRFFDHATQTRNQLTGFQVGGDFWLNVIPGISLGVESKGGIFGNHAEVESQIFSNSIPGAREHLQDGRTAYLGELTASLVYRLSYSLSVKTSYNLLYVDNVALAPENYNTRDLSNALGSGQGAFTVHRFPFIDTDGEVLYQGWSIGGEYLW